MSKNDSINGPGYFPGQRPHMEDFLANAAKHFWYTGLRQEQIHDAIQTACDFFGIPMPQLVYDITNNPNEGTGVFKRMRDTYEDDILQYNMKELVKLGVTNLDAFTLVLTHECMHRVLQRTTLPGRNNGAWEEELACDYFMGVRAAMTGMDEDPVARGLLSTDGWYTHPDGSLRYTFIKQGKQNAYFDLIRRRPVSFQVMYQQFLELLAKHREEIDRLQKPFFPV